MINMLKEGSKRCMCYYGVSTRSFFAQILSICMIPAPVPAGDKNDVHLHPLTASSETGCYHVAGWYIHLGILPFSVVKSRVWSTDDINISELYNTHESSMIYNCQAPNPKAISSKARCISTEVRSTKRLLQGPRQALHGLSTH